MDGKNLIKNIYRKLQEARVKLQDLNLKKSGQNKFSGFKYFELADILPAINKIFFKLGLFGQVAFTNAEATLTIINADAPDERIIFSSPNASVELKGCHGIQNIGAMETYQRRYLYMMALEIVEADTLDAVVGSDEQKSTTPNAKAEPRVEAMATTTEVKPTVGAAAEVKPAAGATADTTTAQTTPAAGAETTYKDEKPVYRCTECGQEIKDFRNCTAEQIIQGTIATYGAAYCGHCFIKRQKREREQAQRGQPQAVGGVIL